MAQEKRQVLIVDRDRIAILISQMLVQKYSTDVATDGLNAVKKLQELLPAVIVADVNIPGDGISLAELVGISPKYHTVPVILMSSNPSPDVVIRARNAGAYSYLAKPFGPSDLQRRIDAVLSAPEKDETKAICERVKKIEKLPAFPATHAEILKLAQSEEATSRAIAEKIQLDPGLLATIFKLVNSSYYGFQIKVDSLKLAITLLGLEEIANLVMSAQVFETLGSYEGGAGLDLQAFWKHSVGIAFIVRTIAKKLHMDAESAFLAGMLHDLGKVVLDRCFTDYYKPVIETAKREEVPLVCAEQELLGLTHSDVGGQLGVEWEFSDNILEAILHHHQPERASSDPQLVYLVHLADIICQQFECESEEGDRAPEVNEKVLHRLSLSQRGFLLLKEAAKQDLQNASSFLTALSN